MDLVEMNQLMQTCSSAQQREGVLNSMQQHFENSADAGSVLTVTRLFVHLKKVEDPIEVFAYVASLASEGYEPIVVDICRKLVYFIRFAQERQPIFQCNFEDLELELRAVQMIGTIAKYHKDNKSLTSNDLKFMETDIKRYISRYYLESVDASVKERMSDDISWINYCEFSAPIFKAAVDAWEPCDLRHEFEQIIPLNAKMLSSLQGKLNEDV